MMDPGNQVARASFDPSRHVIVARDKITGKHVYVTLADIVAAEQPYEAQHEAERVQSAVQAAVAPLLHEIAQLKENQRMFEAPLPPVPAEVRQVPTDSRAGWSLKELMANADASSIGEEAELPPDIVEPPIIVEPLEFDAYPEPTWPQPPVAPLPDDERRQLAKSRLKGAVSNAGRILFDDQPRYELAIQAKNGSVYAMGLFEDEAKVRGTTVAALADAVIAERKVRQEQLMKLFAAEARIQSHIDTAEGDEIDFIATAGIAEVSKQGA